MSIRPHPRHEGWYVVDYYPDGRKGKRIREPVKGMEHAIALENSLKNQKHAPAKVVHPPLQDIVDEYLLSAKQDLAAATYETRERRLRFHIIPALGKYRVRDLNQTILDGYRATVAYWTYHTDLTILKAVVRWMVTRKLADGLSFQPEIPKGVAKTKDVPHPSDMIRAIGNLKNPVHRVLFGLMLYTGLRWNEARSIRWENVNIKSGTIGIKEIERGQQDSIYIPPPLLEWFQANYQAAGLVFEGRNKGKPFEHLWKVYRQLSADCGCRITSHSFRHASATYLYEQTGDIYLVQQHLRHKKVTTSQIYARMSVKKRLSAVNAVCDYVDASSKQ
ncbi:MAG: site-specific integrase [Geobacter sp.]|nr:site-specific integrase [Geobacter sp.]